MPFDTATTAASTARIVTNVHKMNWASISSVLKSKKKIVDQKDSLFKMLKSIHKNLVNWHRVNP